MIIINDIRIMQERSRAARLKGERIAFVPTMGFLHAGHLSLLQEGRRRGDLLVLSIFVNPTQFGAGEDFASYPRDLAADAELARRAGVDVLFAPEAPQMYPAGYATYVDVEGLTETLCGASRPGHFRGVTTVVTKLFNIVAPDVALFGCKDFQQLAVIRCMSADLNLPVEIVGMPIVREPDGLALSSRNVYLSVGQRQQALVLSRGIARARELARSGVESVGEILAVLRALIEEQAEARIDYLQICHQQTLQEQERLDADSVLLMAVFIGKTRLLDNALLFSRD
ncbi:pantothenate synthetase [Desulfuromonas soudanensis]|uniref:Pantothenate synthetase n=1 Tax=Desulfuromonas soudanensis TaxID=1603606 RepID=A0A0M3QFK1_9BACT|nr:pantoate--beta-alanine ligase [Desulfuromonas soudanensis]ALC16369.1 pantothenate synthetase [Desulfuromonas soudanensis]